MLVHMNKLLIATSLLIAAACGGGVATSSPTPTASATPVPTASSSATPVPGSPSPSTTPSASPIPLPTTAQVAAAGNGVVWMLVADHLYRSTDKGQTWTERTWPPSLPALIAFTSDKDGWRLELGSPATQCQSQKVAVGNTFDGATTWRGLDGTGIADAQCKGAITFVDAQRGYMSTYSPNDRPLIYRTTDGGKTWKASAPLPDPAGFTTQPGGFALTPGPVSDFGSVQLVFASGNAGAGKQVGYVYRSTDGGATWSPVAGTTPPSGVVIVTATRWIQISTPGDSKETTDGGASWHAYTTDYAQAAPIAPQIVFGDAQTGYATVRGSLQRTTDGGAHWTTLKTPGT